MSSSRHYASDKAQTAISLEETLTFERLLGDISAKFSNLPPACVGIETEIERVLKQLVEFLGFDRSSFGEFKDEDGTFRGQTCCRASRG